jgi:glutamate-1-semialdehyde 2,1-aminomutase
MADPTVFQYGRASHVWDVTGREYIDYTLSQGPLIHGHSRPEILSAVQSAIARGQIWNGLHEQEIELAEKLVQIIPCADAVRFGCTGSEAVQAALRLARAFTGRPKVVKFEGHYHGWLDSVAVSVNPTLDLAGLAGTPNAVPWSGGLATGSFDGLVIAPWNDLSALEEIVHRNAGSIAAIITEPCMCNAGCVEPATGYLAGIRKLCDRHKVLLIFDEVITGFRLALGGAQEYYSITPDLAVFGKAMASGFPLSVIAGRRDLMQVLADGRAIHAGTLNAHVGCIAAAFESVRLLEEDAACYRKLNGFGVRLQSQLQTLAQSAGLPVLTTGPGSVFHMGFLCEECRGAQATDVRNYRDVVRMYDTQRYAAFVRGMTARGVRLIGRGIWYISTAHSEADFGETIEAARDTLPELSRNNYCGHARG